MTVVSIHQPNYLPWIGYFHKMTYSDVFVFLDSVQYTPKTYTNRCFVLQGGRQTRLSIPVSTDRWDTPILEVRIDTREFAAKHLETMRHAYGRCGAFAEVMEVLEPHYRIGETNLADFNIGLITALADYMGLSPRFVRLSELSITSAKNELLIDVTKACRGEVFVSGTGGRSFIAPHGDDYAEAGVSLAFQNFIHPSYRQRASNFVPGCSCLDLIFNSGPRSKDVVTGQSERAYVPWRGAR